jgi:hypothetical protein
MVVPDQTKLDAAVVAFTRELDVATGNAKKAISQAFEAPIAEITSQLTELAKARKEFEEVTKVVQNVLEKQSPEQRVVISAGGEKFELTVESLQRGGGAFSRLVGGEEYFFDISPLYFRALADYMRTGVSPDSKGLDPATFLAYCDKYLQQPLGVVSRTNSGAATTSPAATSSSGVSWQSRCSKVFDVAVLNPLLPGLIAHFKTATHPDDVIKCSKADHPDSDFDRLIFARSTTEFVSAGKSFFEGRTMMTSVDSQVDASFDVTFPKKIVMTSFRLVYGGSCIGDAEGTTYSRPTKWSIWSDGKEIYRNEEDSFAKNMIQLLHLPTPVDTQVLTFKLHDVAKRGTYQNANRFAVKMLEVYGGILKSASPTTTSSLAGCSVVKLPTNGPETAGLINHLNISHLNPSSQRVRCTMDATTTSPFDRCILEPYSSTRLGEGSCFVKALSTMTVIKRPDCNVAHFKVTFDRNVTMTSFRLVYGGTNTGDTGMSYSRPVKWSVWADGKVIYENDKDDFAKSMCCLFTLDAPTQVTELTFKLHGTTPDEINCFAVKMLEVYGGYK